MFRRRKIDDGYKVFVEVLQNGELLSEISRPYNRPSTISLTANPNGELTAPFYPLPSDIELLRITGRGVEIDLDHNWEGFTTFEGKIEDISSHRSTQYTHLMKKGDYGSIAYNDLRVLIRIGKDRIPHRRRVITKKPGEYRGGFFRLMIGDSNDFKMLAIAGLASLWLLGSFSKGLLDRQDTRPSSLLDLTPSYTLPFIHPTHLDTLPEAIQSRIDPERLIRSGYEYYMNLADTILGFSHTRHPAIFESTYQMYKEGFRNQKARISQIVEQKSDLDRKFFQKKYRTNIIIPTIKGESIDQSLLRLEDKLEIIHKSLSLTLKKRREISPEFKKEPLYDPSLYKGNPRTVASETPLNRRGGLTGINTKSPEERLYENADNLAKEAKALQSYIEWHRESHEPLSPKVVRPVLVRPSNLYINFSIPNDFDGHSDKLKVVRASDFDDRRINKVKEPLLGEINPELINRAVSRNRFQLQLCFELALRRNQLLKGSMEWKWRLDTKGKISDLQLLESSINDRRMIRCVRKKIARWKFPSPRRGSVEIKYPFYFAPAKG